ncbi:unnamed protein product, partial [Didymodactylos carnosus]
MTFDSTASVWICVLTATDKGSSIAKDYIRLQMDEMNTGDVVILLGTYLFEMGEYKKSKDYFENLKQRRGKNDPNVSLGLGRAHYALDEYKEALQYFASARAIYLEKDPPDLFNAAKVALYAGNAFRFRSEYDEALSSYTESLNFYETLGIAESLSTTSVLSSLVLILNRMFPDQRHRDTAKAIHLLARIHVARQDDPKALTYFRQAFEIWNVTL